jgi:hypothetical protein
MIALLCAASLQRGSRHAVLFPDQDLLTPILHRGNQFSTMKLFLFSL